MTNGNSKGGKRNRRTRVEMLAELKAKQAKLEAQIAGTFDETTGDNYIVTRLKRAIRRRETAVGVANTLLHGKGATDKSPAVASIVDKIANAEKRLADLRMAQTRAFDTIARVPADVDVLRAALAEAETGKEVEFPTGLYILPGENDRTEAEVEAGSVSNQDA
jgi:chromosome segregation ATPase